MANILTARVNIRGVRPLLWHHFGPDALPLEKRERTGVAGNDPEEWKRTYLATPEGQLYVEPTYAFGCIVNGAYHIKKGKGSIQKLVAATLQVLDDRILIDRFLPQDGPTPDSSQPVYIDIRSAVNPGTSRRNVRYRLAASIGWRATFSVMWDPTVVSRSELHSAIIESGRLVGIGDGRKIGFGRFVVELFEVVEDKAGA